MMHGFGASCQVYLQSSTYKVQLTLRVAVIFICRIIQALFTAASYLHEKINRQKVLAAV